MRILVGRCRRQSGGLFRRPDCLQAGGDVTFLVRPEARGPSLAKRPAW